MYVIFKHKFDNAVKHIETDSKEYYIDQLKPLNTQPKKDRHTPYKRNLAFILNRIDSFFGEKLFSYKAFDRHLTFSFIYSFLLFYIVWFFGGRGGIGEITFLENLTFFEKSLQTLFLIFVGLIIYLYLKYENKIVNFLKAKLKISNLLANILYIVGVGVGVGVVGINTNSITLILFFLILTIINAILDLTSLAFTRYLSKKILNENRWYIILFHALLDVFMAFVFLSLLAFLLIVSIDAFNTFFVDDFKNMISVSELIRSLEKNPFSGDSLWITLILFSTLIPTFIHFMIAIYGALILLASRKTKKEKIIAILERENIKSYEVTEVATYFAMKWLITTILAFGLTFALGALVYKVWL